MDTQWTCIWFPKWLLSSFCQQCWARSWNRCNWQKRNTGFLFSAHLSTYAHQHCGNFWISQMNRITSHCATLCGYVTGNLRQSSLTQIRCRFSDARTRMLKRKEQPKPTTLSVLFSLQDHVHTWKTTYVIDKDFRFVSFAFRGWVRLFSLFFFLAVPFDNGYGDAPRVDGEPSLISSCSAMCLGCSKWSLSAVISFWQQRTRLESLKFANRHFRYPLWA